MSSRALYREYRSRSFDEVVGQSHVTELLKTAIKSGKIAHAYLLTGPRGVGKTSVARIIAHEVNELPYSEDPHLDIIEIDAASNRRIDDIRDLRDKVHIAPTSAKYKVYIIDEVHMLTGESFNALLKTLEEPPAHVIFILATTEVHKVPATILSRTQRYHLRPARNDDVVAHLTNIAKKEKIDVEPAALELIAIHAGGSFRDSVSLLDQLSGLGSKVSSPLVESVLGMANQSQVEGLVDALLRGDTDKLLTSYETLQREGISAIVLCEQLSRTIMEKARTTHSLYELLDELTDVPKAHDPALKLLTTLVRHAGTRQKKTVATKTPTQPSVAAKPAELKALQTPKMPKTVVSKTTDSASEPASSSQKQTFDWAKVLNVVKKHQPPLHSVLTRARAAYDESANQLALTFTYALHRKKLESPSSREYLSSVMHDLFDLEPELVISDGRAATEMSGDAKAVAAIMGGGEPVNASV